MIVSVHVHPDLSALCVDVKLRAQGMHDGRPVTGAYVLSAHALQLRPVASADCPIGQSAIHLLLYGDQRKFASGHTHPVFCSFAVVPVGHE